MSNTDESPRGREENPAESPADAAAARNEPDTITVVVCVAGSALLEALRNGMAATEDLRIVGAEVELSVAMDLVELLKPRVALVDTGQVDRGGEVALRRLHRAAGSTRILLHSLPEMERMIGYVVNHGVMGALSQTSTIDLCLKAIRAVNAGEFWLGRDMTARVLNRLLTDHKDSDALDDAKRRLTEREAQIVRLLKDGFTDKEVGQTLGISPTTVKTHVGKVFDKMGIWRRAQL